MADKANDKFFIIPKILIYNLMDFFLIISRKLPNLSHSDLLLFKGVWAPSGECENEIPIVSSI